jgi:type IV pilus assembly protein PilE
MKKAKGFTLIEIMIVVAIIAVLAMVAMPAYNGQVRKGHRAAAQAVMMDLANKQQLYLQTARQYAATPADLNVTIPADVQRMYDITIVAADGTPPIFTITATPKTGTSQEIDGPITLDQAGAKTPAGKW